MKSFFGVFAAALIVGGCSGGQHTIPGAPGLSLPQLTSANGYVAGGLKLMGNVRPDKSCPSSFTYCVTLSHRKSATLYWCYSPGSYCGPSQYQYTWEWAFYTYPSGSVVSYFNGVFNPNPGDPTYDTIKIAAPVKSTHGHIKYVQALCPGTPSNPCIVVAYVGIRVK